MDKFDLQYSTEGTTLFNHIEFVCMPVASSVYAECTFLLVCMTVVKTTYT